MKSITRKADIVATNPWFVIVASICSISSFMWFLYDKWVGSATAVSLSIFVISLTATATGFIYSIKVRSENIALRGIAEIFNEINEIYRDSLKELFAKNQPVTDPNTLISEENKTLNAVCQRIEKIFTRITGRDCTVTIKLICEKDGRSYATTLTRNEAKSARDNNHTINYSVGTGENIAFDTALRGKSSDRLSHYFSPDLRKEKNYTNQRQDYIKFYKSVLVVPIRGVNAESKGSKFEFDDIGFLCVDLKSTNRLNNGYHLHILTSLSNQMYNFMSLMRGKYTVFVG